MIVLAKPEGRTRSAVWTAEDIKDRCWVDESTGCWHWRGGRNSAGNPSMWLPAVQRSVTMGTALCVVVKGRPLRPGELWHSVCGTRHCGNPAHNRSGTAATLPRNVVHSPATRARISDVMRKRSKLTEADCAEIRASAEHSEVLAARFGISASYANKIRSADRRLPRDAAPGASVFSWAAA